MITSQLFPSVDIEPLPSGLFELTCYEHEHGAQTVHLHPVHVQVLAQMIGRPLPDKARAALARLQSRIAALHKRASDLEGQLRAALIDQSLDVAPELASAEHITERLGELADDLAELSEPTTIDADELATDNHHGQLLLIGEAQA